MTSKLDLLREMTIVVADTGDAEAVRRFKPEDCTTNPSLVLKAIQSGAYDAQVAEVVRPGMSLEDAVTELTVTIGTELAGIVPGRVSTEVDARLSFDVDAMIRRAHDFVDAYAKRGIGTERLLIKLATTWEGVRAAERLQKEGIDCNLTLLFSMAQARACADAGVFLISPFVGRITDWYKAKTGETYTAETDPGVKSVRAIHEFYKSQGIETIVMGASFRNTGQIEALAGCDRLTISPQLLDELAADQGELPRVLGKVAKAEREAPISEADFRWEMNEDAMASDKLAEGIRNFHADAVKLEEIVKKMIA